MANSTMCSDSSGRESFGRRVQPRVKNSEPSTGLELNFARDIGEETSCHLVYSESGLRLECGK